MGNAWMGKNNLSCNAKITSVTSGGQNLQMDAWKCGALLK